MSYIDVSEINARISALVDQSITPPTWGGAEANLRLKFVNMAYSEFYSAYDWLALRKDFWPGITGMSTASVSLPGDYNKMAAMPRNYSTGMVDGEEWSEIQPDKAKTYGTTDKYFYILGNRSSGFNMICHPATLASGASIYIQYYSIPTSLASPADVPLVPDPEFLVRRTVAYILETRSDARFQQQEVKARETLLNMIQQEEESKYASFAGRENEFVKTSARVAGFRVGRD